ncbi:MAG TPA: hemerythrin domain-containing protein [Candidatus Binatia bacterium]|nr:hemerythrin domain-containing protein [Candidatus Binatia bacterium]
MAEVTQALREEHQFLHRQIARLLVVADSVGDLSPNQLQRGIDEVYDFLAHRLIPYAEAEEEVLYPALCKALGTPQATITMSRDHVEISRRTEELRILRGRIQEADFDLFGVKELRRTLYGLHSILTLHLAKEEEIYLPILDNSLNDAEAHQLCHRIAEISRSDANHLGH